MSLPLAVQRAYLHHRIQTLARCWQQVATALAGERARFDADAGTLYGIWRSQIGRPRDELNMLTHWDDAGRGQTLLARLLASVPEVVDYECWPMHATLRPVAHAPPTRQGNYAFRHFRTPPAHWDEFLQLCAQAWPGFEASYPDSQIIGLWRYEHGDDALIASMMLIRRPDLAAWERTKLPQGAREEEVRRKLSRRYDLCESTFVHTTTLLTATDRRDDARWA